MNRRTIFPILGAIVALPFIGLPKGKARPITRRKIWGQRKLWIGSGKFNDPYNWDSYGIPRSADTIVVNGGELTIPPGRNFKRLEVHEGIVKLDIDSCGDYCCFDEIVVYDQGRLEPGVLQIGEACSGILVR